MKVKLGLAYSPKMCASVPEPSFKSPKHCRCKVKSGEAQLPIEIQEPIAPQRQIVAHLPLQSNRNSVWIPNGLLELKRSFCPWEIEGQETVLVHRSTVYTLFITEREREMDASYSDTNTVNSHVPKSRRQCLGFIHRHPKVSTSYFVHGCAQSCLDVFLSLHCFALSCSNWFRCFRVKSGLFEVCPARFPVPVWMLELTCGVLAWRPKRRMCALSDIAEAYVRCKNISRNVQTLFGLTLMSVCVCVFTSFLVPSLRYWVPKLCFPASGWSVVHVLFRSIELKRPHFGERKSSNFKPVKIRTGSIQRRMPDTYSLRVPECTQWRQFMSQISKIICQICQISCWTSAPGVMTSALCFGERVQTSSHLALQRSMASSDWRPANRWESHKFLQLWRMLVWKRLQEWLVSDSLSW